MLLGTLGASLFKHLSTGKRVIWTCEEKKIEQDKIFSATLSFDQFFNAKLSLK